MEAMSMAVVYEPHMVSDVIILMQKRVVCMMTLIDT